MANSLISMIKGNSTLINNTEVLNGQVLFNTDEKSILLDDNNTRSEYCGADKSNKNLASIENGTTASKGYSVGSYVVWKGQLYRVTRQINSGTAFNVGYNITSDTVGAELTSLGTGLALKQNASDSNLDTVSKTVVGAINELNYERYFSTTLYTARSNGAKTWKNLMQELVTHTTVFPVNFLTRRMLLYSYTTKRFMFPLQGDSTGSIIYGSVVDDEGTNYYYEFIFDVTNNTNHHFYITQMNTNTKQEVTDVVIQGQLGGLAIMDY